MKKTLVSLLLIFCFTASFAQSSEKEDRKLEGIKNDSYDYVGALSLNVHLSREKIEKLRAVKLSLMLELAPLKTEYRSYSRKLTRRVRVNKTQNAPTSKGKTKRKRRSYRTVRSANYAQYKAKRDQLKSEMEYISIKEEEEFRLILSKREFKKYLEFKKTKAI